MKPLYKTPHEEMTYAFVKGNFFSQIKKLSKKNNNLEKAVPFFIDFKQTYVDLKKEDFLIDFGKMVGLWKRHIRIVTKNPKNKAMSGLCYANFLSSENRYQFFLQAEKGKLINKEKQIILKIKSIVPKTKLEVIFLDKKGNSQLIKEEESNQKDEDKLRLNEEANFEEKNLQYEEQLKKNASKLETISPEIQGKIKENAQTISKELKALIDNVKKRKLSPKRALTRLEKIDSRIDKKDYLLEGVSFEEIQNNPKLTQQLKKLQGKFAKDIYELRDYFNKLRLNEEKLDQIDDEIKSLIKQYGSPKGAVEHLVKGVDLKAFEGLLKSIKTTYKIS